MVPLKRMLGLEKNLVSMSDATIHIVVISLRTPEIIRTHLQSSEQTWHD